MKAVSVFDFQDFKDYLAERFSTTGASRGMRIAFAHLIHASPSYVSKILSGKIKFNLEFAPVVSKLLEHNEQESKFFMLLVLYSQAGSKDLENHFKRELEEIVEQRRVDAKWIPEKQELAVKDQLKYYSNWHFGVIHHLISIPAFQTKTAIAQRLKLSISTVTSTLDFLVQIGLIEAKGDRYHNLKRRTHLTKNSDWAPHIHMNMRHFSMHKLTEPDPEDIHYTLIMALAKKDMETLRRKIRQLIQEMEPIMTTNKNEDMCILNLDYFRV